MMRCSPEAFAQCPTSHLCGSLADATFADDSECAAFNKQIQDIVTNADRIRAMSDEELAEWHENCPYIDKECTMKGCAKCILEWLRQPAEEVVK